MEIGNTLTGSVPFEVLDGAAHAGSVGAGTAQSLCPQAVCAM